jgi:hypothetical protein
LGYYTRAPTGNIIRVDLHHRGRPPAPTYSQPTNHTACIDRGVADVVVVAAAECVLLLLLMMMFVVVVVMMVVVVLVAVLLLCVCLCVCDSV